MAIAMRYVLPLVLCQLVVPVVTGFSREVTGARRLEMEDASAQGAMVTQQVYPICYVEARTQRYC
jgi:hypothetical protein